MRPLTPTVLAVGTLALVGMIASAVALFADEHPPTTAEEQKVPLPRPIVSTHELMEMFNEPLYHNLREAVKESAASILPL